MVGQAWEAYRPWVVLLAGATLGWTGWHLAGRGGHGTGRETRDARVWVFERSSAVDFAERSEVEVVPSRYLALRLRLMALAGGGRPPTLAELEVGSAGSGVLSALEPLETGWSAVVKPERLELWRDGGAVRALPRDIHPVALLYREDLLSSAGVDLGSVRTWDELLEACRRYDAQAPAGHRSIEWPRMSASHLVLLMRQTRLVPRDAEGWRDERLTGLVVWYARQVASDVGADVSRRIDLLAESLASGRLAAAVVADWRYGQLRRLLARAPGSYRLRPLPVWREGAAEEVPTWGGTGLGVPLQPDDAARARAEATLRTLYADEAMWMARWSRDAVVPPVPTLWSHVAAAEDGWVSGSAGLFAWLAGGVGSMAGVRLSGEAERGLAVVLFRAVRAAERGGDVEEVVRTGLTLLAERLR